MSLDQRQMIFKSGGGGDVSKEEAPCNVTARSARRAPAKLAPLCNPEAALAGGGESVASMNRNRAYNNDNDEPDTD
ncbi:hypothetical protein Dda_9401 (mitochondrion) [Drechslerella dactyloides]|uniref:Uncharacterized protein n=1 Tax=Drechslerella dactyloides TaxID=74499 RepID=A0AAD6ISZ7_DREDA|nr:hypothetical protein Dda_9401 [Drechslerella dactyloides]